MSGVSRISWTVRFGDEVLTALSGNLSIDEMNVPAIIGTFLVPDTSDWLTRLDPRQTSVPRVTIEARRTWWASQTVADITAYAQSLGTPAFVSRLSAAWAGRTVGDITLQFGTHLDNLGPYDDQTMSLDLHVRRVVQNERAGTLAISLASDEALLTDWAASANSDEVAIAQAQSGMSTNRIAAWTDPVLKVVLGRGLTPTVYDTTALSVDPGELYSGIIGQTAWSFMRPFLEDTDLKLRPNRDGVGFSLQRPENTIPGGPSSHLFLPENVTDVSVEYNRDSDWYDSSILSRPASEGISRGHPDGEHSRTYVEDWTGRKPTLAMAQNIVRRAKNRGAFINLTGPVRPGVFMMDEFTWVPEGGTPDPWRVQAVSFDIDADQMDIRGVRRY